MDEAYPVGILNRINGGRVYVFAQPVILKGEQHKVLADMCGKLAEKCPTFKAIRQVGSLE
jgi:hypothetical protein